jgi:hypothetical protein
MKHRRHSPEKVIRKFTIGLSKLNSDLTLKRALV